MTMQVSLGGGAVGFNWLPILAAERTGIFERNGLEISIKRMGSVDKSTAGVKSGELDIAITPPEGAINDCLAGGPLRIVAGNVNRLPLTLIANPRFRSVEELKGARLGTSSLTEGTAIYTMEMLSRHGLNYPGDYEFAVVGVHPARWKALQDGTIDAAVQLVPLNFVAIDAGYSNLGEVPDYIPEIVFTAMIANDGWASENRHALVQLLRAVMEGARLIADTTQDELLIELVMELTQADRKYAARTLEYAREIGVFSPDLSIPEAALAKSLELMVNAGLLEETQLAEAAGVLEGEYRMEAAKMAV